MKLKNCPFCGSEVEVDEIEDLDVPGYIGYGIFRKDNKENNTICFGCDTTIIFSDSKKETIDSWNKRI
jgi:Lar family restriction alleviation protein